jgi:hypothetical protein
VKIAFPESMTSLSESYKRPWNEEKRLKILKEENCFVSFQDNPTLKELVSLASTYFQVSLIMIAVIFLILILCFSAPLVGLLS